MTFEILKTLLIQTIIIGFEIFIKNWKCKLSKCKSVVEYFSNN